MARALTGDNNFVADVRFEDECEVLQLPIVKNRLKKLLLNGVKKIALVGTPVIPSSEDTLEQFLHSAGRFFGKDPAEWKHMGEPTVTENEEGGKRYIKSTGVFSGIELHMQVEMLHFDERLPVRDDKPELSFNQRRAEILTDDQWQEIIRHQPWSKSVRRQMLTAYLQAKMDCEDLSLASEGCHGMWELSINKENHADVAIDRMQALLKQLRSPSLAVVAVAAAAVWGLATSGSCRRIMAELDVVASVLHTIQRSLKVAVTPDTPPAKGSHDEDAEGVPENAITQGKLAGLQHHLIGALAMLLVDRSCRAPYLAMEPSFTTLFLLCANLPGYEAEHAAARREGCAKILTSLMQRDPEARRSLITTGSLKHVIALLNPDGPGAVMIQFCMASLLATLVLDDELMEMVRDRGDAPLFFEACILLLNVTLRNLHDELDRQDGDYYQDDEEPAVYDLALGIRLAEAAAQAMWGAAYMCVGESPCSVKMEHVMELGKIGIDCVQTAALPLSRVCHCVTATLASMASTADTAQLIMDCPDDIALTTMLGLCELNRDCPDDIALTTMLGLCEVTATESFERAGHVKASAVAGVAFLCVHPLGALGDECMHGPYRTRLLDSGAFGVLLRAALTSVGDDECDMIVQQACSIGLMYMSTMADAVEAAELAMYAALLMDSSSSEMIEFLMAGMWILLRNPANRRCLGSSFSPTKGGGAGNSGMMSKLNDAITLHELNDQAAERAEGIRRTFDGRQSKSGMAEVAAKAVAEAGGARPDLDGVAEDGEEGEEGGSIGGGADGARDSGGGSDGGSARGGAGGGGGGSGGGGARARSGGGGDGGGNGAGERDGSRPGSGGSAGSSQRGVGRSQRSSAWAVPSELADDEGSSVMPTPRSLSRLVSRKDADGREIDGRDLMRQASRPKEEELTQKFDKELKDNWGLDTLVSVGESWLPAMMDQEHSGEVSDIPVLKLFEFLVASICLFMIEDDAIKESRELDLFKFTAPSGVAARHRTWWTVATRAPEPDAVVGLEQERALAIMVKIMGMHLGAAWKSLQLGVLTLWNVCTRNPHMERHVIEAGVCGRLLDIMNRAAWPQSLRDIAGGCLEFLVERHANLRFFPAVALPIEIAWPFPKAPTEGLVPTIAGYINLINSRLPMLEYRGSHGLARICFQAPYGCPDERNYTKEAKAVVAVLGGVDALVMLLKRVNRRYQDIVMGKRGLKSGSGAEAEGDVAFFEKDMFTLEAQQDIYFNTFAALLNVSVLKSVQPLMAKKGLAVLLGTNTMLFGHLNGGPAFTVTATESTEKLLHLCSSIIQNVSLHPQNRTRIYKAELKGGVALDRLIEDATEVDANMELREVSMLLPPLHALANTLAVTAGTMRANYSEPGAPAGGAAKVFANAARVGGRYAAGGKSAGGSPMGSPLPSPGASGSPMAWGEKTAANRALRISKNGAILNTSVDTGLAGVLRPKVVFPPIVEKREANAYARISTAQAKAAGEDGGDDDGGLAGTGTRGDKDGADAPVNSKARFLQWMDSTFDDESGAGADASERKTHRRPMFDEHGDWLETEPESSKALNRILCRPVNHLWMEAPEARARQGKSRWEPVVSEYQESQAKQPLGRSAAKLLATPAPRDEPELMKAAATLRSTGILFGTGRLGSTGGCIDRDSLERPATRERQQGQVALTVLQPNEMQIKAIMDAESAADVDEATSMSRSMMGAETSWHSASAGGARGGGANGAEAQAARLNLKVAIGPKRARQVISFEERIMTTDDPSLPTLTVFEHIEGSKVCEGMFPAYQLPNGKQAFMYYRGGTLLDEVAVDCVAPPPRPSTVPAALQQAMPLADVLNLISKPPGSAPPFIPYKPVPYLVPLPKRHTLKVKRPDVLHTSSFGDLREDNLQLVLVAKKIMKTQTTTRAEDVELAPTREPWSLPNSIFKPRTKETDAKAFFDTDACEEKMFEKDWGRATAKEKFTGMLCRENKSNKSNPKDDKVMLQEVHSVLLQYYKQWYAAFMFYAGCGSGSDPYHMPLNSFTQFLDDCSIADSESQFIKRSDCDTIFIVCNFQPDKKSAEAAVNLENAMMRYEFLEALCRAGLAKYGKGVATDDVALAVRMLLEENVVPNLPASAACVPNEFREQRLYTEEVDMLFKRHAVLLKAIYSRYRLKPSGGGLRTKVMRLEGWNMMLSDAKLIDSQLTLTDGTLAFLWSRMMTIDEIKDYQKYSSFSFIDMLEGLGRIADMKSLPLESELEAAGYNNVMEWAIDKERMEGVTSGVGGNNKVEEKAPSRAGSPGPGDGPGDDEAPPAESSSGAGLHTHNAELFRTRLSAGFDAPKSRPLYAKLELLLDLIFRRLYMDPSQPDLPFNYDGLLKLIKKVDKDLGP
ncbi:hypothetical protein FOA52_012798 [Chlamydomonas sp. UWO 241]|nr:hypothetical protein FOA52_012798 [Chlamydomonas sp. UWO 241]